MVDRLPVNFLALDFNRKYSKWQLCKEIFKVKASQWGVITTATTTTQQIQILTLKFLGAKKMVFFLSKIVVCFCEQFLKLYFLHTNIDFFMILVSIPLNVKQSFLTGGPPQTEVYSGERSILKQSLKFLTILFFVILRCVIKLFFTETLL